MSEMTAGIFFTNLFNAATGAANAGSNPTDVLGTAVGIGQALQGGVSLIAGNVNAIAKPIGGIGGGLSAVGLTVNFNSIRSDLKAGKNPTLSDLAGAVGNAASLAGSVLVIVGVAETLAIPIAVATGLAGTVQLIGSATGYRIDTNWAARARRSPSSSPLRRSRDNRPRRTTHWSPTATSRVTTTWRKSRRLSTRNTNSPRSKVMRANWRRRSPNSGRKSR